METHKLYLYPVWLRIWHGLNALCIIVLIITGLSMQYGSLNYPLISFKTAVSLHNISAVIATFGYTAFLIGNFISDNGMQYRFKIKGLFERLYKQGMYYLCGYFKAKPKPYPISTDSKFNPLQRFSYAVTMYILVPIVLITGIALFFPNLIIERVYIYSGIQLTAVLHSIMGFFVSIFLIIHLYVASIGKNPLRNFKSIITGYHEAD